MLRITIRTEGTVTTLALEGRLAGPWVDELSGCWSRLARAGDGVVDLDLSGVTFIDETGKALLTRLWEEGADLQASGCLIRSIVDQIKAAGGATS